MLQRLRDVLECARLERRGPRGRMALRQALIMETDESARGHAALYGAGPRITRDGGWV